MEEEKFKGINIDELRIGLRKYVSDEGLIDILVDKDNFAFTIKWYFEKEGLGLSKDESTREILRSLVED